MDLDVIRNFAGFARLDFEDVASVFERATELRRVDRQLQLERLDLLEDLHVGVVLEDVTAIDGLLLSVETNALLQL